MHGPPDAARRPQAYRRLPSLPYRGFPNPPTVRLPGACKGDELKVRLAARIRTERILSLKGIAEHLAMGRWTHVSNLPRANRKGKFKK
jgi:hypothetical protein